ncbi:dihydrodipicolinate synthase family protein [Devosia algicola]|uniref:Dihydrodipicolinate synthase family protein n=1 Tax=Devosia algicola TaxID=3026418 RepID=A0ABY7YPL7_9HYPH|nr:dihydrodipicolinate synthase family protein [Devosia algicola]WDR03132.1 dihydrodipicolinate synthase family protein [Devosia algicola]
MMEKVTLPENAPQGIWGTILLPIDKNDAIDWVALADEIDILAESGVSGIYSNGTAGEFHNQTEVEYERVTMLVSERARKSGIPFQIGVSHTNPRIARDRLGRVRDLAPSAVQFTLPDWWAPSMAEVSQFVLGMQAAAGTTPLVLYNPPHAKVTLTPMQIAELRKLAPNLVGAKLAGGDADWYAARRSALAGFSVFVAGHTVAFGRPLGADGAYSNVACLSPRGAMLHWKLAGSDHEAAVELEARIQAFMSQYVMPLVKSHGLSNGALDKLMAAAGGWGPVSQRLLWPYSSAPDDAVTRASLGARSMLPEFF